MTDARSSRRREDLAKLEALQTEYKNAVMITKRTGDPLFCVELDVKVKTAKNRNYPEQTQAISSMRIELPNRYPLDPPKVSITTPIWNPNIFPSGLICLGLKWMPSHNLALLVQRVMQIIALDPTIINLSSPANRDAATWYAEKRTSSPVLFPTITLDALRAPPAPKISWRAIK